MVKVIEFGASNTIINNYIAELRDVNVQGDRMRFRKNLERIGELAAYEISKTLDYQKVCVRTPLGEKEMNVLVEQPVLATIMRAGLPLHQGFLNVFDKADNAFIAAYRKYDKNEDFEIRIEYYSAANIDGRVLMLVDPMLATGSSLVQCLEGLLHEEMVPLRRYIVGRQHRRRADSEGIYRARTRRCRRFSIRRERIKEGRKGFRHIDKKDKKG